MPVYIQFECVIEVRTANIAVTAMFAGLIKPWADFKECEILVPLY